MSSINILKVYQLGNFVLIMHHDTIKTYMWIRVAYSSTIQYSDIMIGPPSAMIVALGWITVPPAIVISPFRIQSSHTVAPGIIFTLEWKKQYQ